MRLALGSLFACALGVRAQVSIPFDQYLTGLGDTLKANGMNILSNAIGTVNGSDTGAALLEALYRGVGFTLFGPVDAVGPAKINHDRSNRHMK